MRELTMIVVLLAGMSASPVLAQQRFENLDLRLFEDARNDAAYAAVCGYYGVAPPDCAALLAQRSPPGVATWTCSESA